MAKIKVIHDRIGEILTIYFDDPEKTEVCEETGEGVILIKNKNNQVIGFEKLYFKPSDLSETLTVETSVTGTTVPA